jgi:hypothetical protein
MRVGSAASGKPLGGTLPPVGLLRAREALRSADRGPEGAGGKHIKI